MNKVFSMILVVAVLGTAGCYYDNKEELYPGEANCDTTGVTFSGFVKPLIDSKCATAGCHQGTTPSGYDLATHTGIANVANNGKLVAAINHTGPSPMPKGMEKLDACTITKITKWVNDGAPNN